jgi:hypothetical protein
MLLSLQFLCLSLKRGYKKVNFSLGMGFEAEESQGQIGAVLQL